MPAFLHIARIALVFCGVVAMDAAEATPKIIRCGALESATFKTENVAGSTTSTTFVPIPFVTSSAVVPAGQQRCIRLTFSAVTQCNLNFVTNNNDGCFVRASHNGAELDPRTDGVNFETRSALNIGTATTYVWVVRLGPGVHDFVIKQRVVDADTTFEVRSWTLSTEVLK